MNATRRPRRRFGLIAAIVGSIGLAAVAFGVAQARTSGPDVVNPTPEEIAEVIDHITDKVVDRIDGTEAQKKQLGAILNAKASEAINLRNEGRALKKRTVEALLRDGRPDRKELEALRQEALTLADRGSLLLMDTILDVSGVLTDEQLAEIRDKVSWWYR